QALPDHCSAAGRVPRRGGGHPHVDARDAAAQRAARGKAGHAVSRVRVAPLAAPFGACVAAGCGILLWIAGINPLPALAVAGGAAVVFGALASVEVGAAALIAAVALFQREKLFAFSIPVMGGGLQPTDILLILTLVGWAARSVARGATRTVAEELDRDPRRHLAPLPRPVTWILLGFIAWASLSAAAGIMAGNGFKESLLELRPLLQYLLFVPIVASLGSQDRKSTRLNSSHVKISYAVFC